MDIKTSNIAAMFVAGAMLASSLAAQALCTQSGEVARVTTLPGAGVSTVYFRNTSLATFYWSATTTDAKLLDAANAALAGGGRVTATGNAVACPVAGIIRDMGTMTQLIHKP